MRRGHTLAAGLALCLAAVLLSGCILLRPAPPSPWQVTVTSAESTEEWDEFYVDADSDNYIVVVTVEYRNLRNASVDFAPESVLLVYTGTDESGWAQTPALHKASDSSVITDFWEESIVYQVEAGQARTGTFIYEFPRGYTEFALYFPETVRIPVLLE